MFRKSVSSRNALSECRIRLKLKSFFFQRSAKGHRADGLARLFFKTGLQGSNLVRLFGDELLQSLMIALVQDGRATTAGLVDQSIEA